MIGIKDNINIWVEKYRPRTIDDFVGNEQIKDKFRSFIKCQEINNLMLHGPAGTGKSSISYILANAIDMDVKILNGSDKNGVDDMRELAKEASQVGLKRWKCYIINEADYITHNSQAMLRDLIERVSGHCRFIFTLNHIERITEEALLSRCQPIEIYPPDIMEVKKHVFKILKLESVQFTKEDFNTIVESNYPDIRKILNTCQSNTIDNILKLDKQTIVNDDYMIKVLEQLKNNNNKGECFKNIRQIINNSKVRDYTNFYTFLFNNIDNLINKDNSKIPNLILNINEGQIYDRQVVDKEINFMATIVKILNIL